MNPEHQLKNEPQYTPQLHDLVQFCLINGSPWTYEKLELRIKIALNARLCYWFLEDRQITTAIFGREFEDSKTVEVLFLKGRVKDLRLIYERFRTLRPDITILAGTRHFKRGFCYSIKKLDRYFRLTNIINLYER